MELILWRHAEAEDGDPDVERALTPKGHRQAAKAAGWLDRHLPGSCRIYVSPATRAVQTAEALGRKFRILDALAPDAEPEQLLAAAGWPNGREPVLIVGHQPTLGQAAAMLLAGQRQDWPMRKAGIWWIARKENGDGSVNVLRVAMAPEFISR